MRAPDGYTLSIGHWGTHVAIGAIYPLRFDLLNDLVPISLIASTPWLVVARKTMASDRSWGTHRLVEGEHGQGVGGHGRHGQSTSM